MVAIVAIGALSAVAAQRETDTPSNNRPSGGSDLLPAHKTMVDNLAADGDCESLQARFDDAADNRGTPGSDLAARNLALMEYADDAMRDIGCY